MMYKTHKKKHLTSLKGQCHMRLFTPLLLMIICRTSFDFKYKYDTAESEQFFVLNFGAFSWDSQTQSTVRVCGGKFVFMYKKAGY